MADYQGRELPKLTMALARRRDAAQQATGERAWRAEWDFLAEALGKDVLAQEVGGESVDQADVAALDATFARVCSAYDAPRIQAQRDQAAATLSALDGIGAENVQNLAKAVEVLSKLGGRQGFRSVD